MSIVTRLIAAIRSPTVTKSSDVGFAGSSSSLGMSLGGLFSSTGTPVSAISALQTPVYACCRVLSEDIARLPVKVRRRLPKGGAEDDRKHPVARLMRQPNDYQTAFEFWLHMVWSLTLRGNAYAYIRRASDGTPVELVSLIPDRVSVLVNEQTGAIYYNASHQRFGSNTRTVSAEDMIHVRNVSLDGGIMGVSPISVGQESIGLASAMQNHAATVFQRGTMLRGLLTTDKTLSAEAAKSLGSAWEQSYTGAGNAHKIAVLEDGLKFQSMSMTPEDALLVDQRKLGIEDIARLFRVPLHKIGAAPASTSGDTEVLEAGYVNDSLTPIVRRIEEALEMRLLFADERDEIEIRFDFDAMLRSDLRTRYDCHQIALLNGIMNTNEIRAIEGLPPVEHGDTYRVPMNQQSLASDSTVGMAMTNPKPADFIASDEKPIAADDEDTQ